MASVEPNDIDLVELADNTAWHVLAWPEFFGFFEPGQSDWMLAQGQMDIDGQLPINPSGGLLAKGHPVGATGVGQLYEVVRQLRDNHPNPVRNARIGMAHNLGGTGVACTVSLLGRAS
jgi:acetyl-CoA C-acetyltransferase